MDETTVRTRAVDDHALHAADYVRRHIQQLAEDLYAHGWVRTEIAQLVDTLKAEALRQASQPPGWAQHRR